MHRLLGLLEINQLTKIQQKKHKGKYDWKNGKM